MHKHQKFWDRIAGTYAKQPIKNQSAFKSMVANIREHVSESDRVFDFGCGTGTYSIEIADKVNFIDAADISKKMLEIATQRAHSRGITNINFQHLDIFDIKLESGSFNVVLAFNILHLQQDLNKVLQRIYELLTPGGLLISKTVCAGEQFSLLTFLMKPISKLGILPHVNCFTIDELQSAIRRNHLEILKTEKNYKGSMEYFVVARKPNPSSTQDDCTPG